MTSKVNLSWAMIKHTSILSQLVELNAPPPVFCDPHETFHSENTEAYSGAGGQDTRHTECSVQHCFSKNGAASRRASLRKAGKEACSGNPLGLLPDAPLWGCLPNSQRDWGCPALAAWPCLFGSSLNSLCYQPLPNKCPICLRQPQSSGFLQPRKPSLLQPSSTPASPGVHDPGSGCRDHRMGSCVVLETYFLRIY